MSDRRSFAFAEQVLADTAGVTAADVERLAVDVQHVCDGLRREIEDRACWSCDTAGKVAR